MNSEKKWRIISDTIFKNSESWWFWDINEDFLANWDDLEKKLGESKNIGEI